ncbi:unnamed protein product [Brugia timori]|uniref:Uncharacterized protein n=1 Tax=Brugia timori TaxID=42155 RepID=A0A0R3QHV3_9BILA|nr:unnamed protein product [Brugia timori]
MRDCFSSVNFSKRSISFFSPSLYSASSFPCSCAIWSSISSLVFGIL